ncbi:hypothetical protein BN1221_03086c [Brenneria goodwinii]|uniref:Uncharacterized protein n=1 Tax=Brenneria goodwinii TaxID=1109412 RepID=A0A0G4JXD7_9GAMM|nr:hypothetical protein BN1221_03086c [Brenneria goodwinii]
MEGPNHPWQGLFKMSIPAIKPLKFLHQLIDFIIFQYLG